MNFLDPRLDEYAANHTGAEPALLAELSRETHLKTTMPRMLSGHLQGRFLSLLSHLVQPACALEIGTFTGYAALCLAEGLADNGKLFTIDSNEETSSIARRYVAKAGMENKIELVSGNAMEIIPGMNRVFDLVFIDADKENYSHYFDMVIGKMRKGGIIIADNVLWSGKVLEAVKENDHETKALLAFNSKVSSDPRVEHLLLPIRDGLMIMRVK